MTMTMTMTMTMAITNEQAVVLSATPRKRLLLGSARILTITGTGFDRSASMKCALHPKPLTD
jgi:hypothetical protein